MLLTVGPLGDNPLDAAARFHAEHLPRVRAALESGTPHLTLVFDMADHTHRGWRLALVQGLARDHAPQRVNALESGDGDDEASAAAAIYLAGAEGVTGQVLRLDGRGAGAVL